jgi:V-type H+-transporting ATPase subunit F
LLTLFSYKFPKKLTHSHFLLQDTVTGFLLAGVGHRTASGSNFLIVNQDTKLQLIEEAFQNFSTRADVGIILINQHVANTIRHVLKNYTETIPTVLEIPSKEHPYDPEQDYIMVRSFFLVFGALMGTSCPPYSLTTLLRDSICFTATRQHVPWRGYVICTIPSLDFKLNTQKTIDWPDVIYYFNLLRPSVNCFEFLNYLHFT